MHLLNRTITVVLHIRITFYLSTNGHKKCCNVDNLIFHLLIFVFIHPVEKILSVWHRKTNGSRFNGIDLWIRGLRQDRLNFAAKSGFSGKINRGRL